MIGIRALQIDFPGVPVLPTARHRMKELFRERDLIKVTYYQSLLEAAGIPTFLRNADISTTEGVSIPDFFPALCILNDDDYQSATELLRNDLRQAESSPMPEVTCGKCGEKSPGNFDTCWNCQSPLPAHYELTGSNENHGILRIHGKPMSGVIRPNSLLAEWLQWSDPLKFRVFRGSPFSFPED